MKHPPPTKTDIERYRCWTAHGDILRATNFLPLVNWAEEYVESQQPEVIEKKTIEFERRVKEVKEVSFSILRSAEEKTAYDAGYKEALGLAKEALMESTSVMAALEQVDELIGTGQEHVTLSSRILQIRDALAKIVFRANKLALLKTKECQSLQEALEQGEALLKSECVSPHSKYLEAASEVA